MLSRRFGLIAPSFGSIGEQHGALEAVMLGQDLGQLRQRLFRPIFFVAADEHDVLALTGTLAPFELEPRILGASGSAWRNSAERGDQSQGTQ